MTRAACARNVHRVYGRLRILDGNNRVRVPMAIPAARRFDVTQRGNLGVKCVLVSRKTPSMTIAACSRRLFLPGNQVNVGDFMGGVAVAADRRSGIARA